ncbi:uncharacterized protein LOC134948090 isoform X2 [Pseudophryne corroboree]|uniref:uncharacterized protein LOC134948090 isoform X2 n=1 Tax=Pseudophryne corroboree TaxID=495146 RepID=UPI003081DDAB
MTQQPAPGTLPNTLPGPSKAKVPAKSPYGASSCASAPALTTRSPAASHPPLKAKRGAITVSAGVTRERHIATVTRPGPRLERPNPSVLVTVRVKKSGLKVLDPEKVKTLTSAARSPVSGGPSRNSLHHQTSVHKQSPQSRRQAGITRSPVKQATPARMRTEIAARRQSVRQTMTGWSEDAASQLLTQQLDGLALRDQDRAGSTCDKCREVEILPQASFQAAVIQTKDSTSVGADAHSLEEPSERDPQNPTGLLTPQTTPANNIEPDAALSSGDIAEVDCGSTCEQTGTAQEPPAGEDMKSQTEPSPCHSRDIQTPETASPGISPSSSSDTKAAGALHCPSSGPEPATETQCQAEKATSTHSHSINETGSVSKDSKSLSAELDLTENNNMSLGQSSNPAGMSVFNNQAETSPRAWSGSSEVIRQSQGVLILTRSTNENAIFIPKLKFAFTPDNSIDWTALRPPAVKSEGDQTKMDDARNMKPCTPWGPSFSKSVLKKSSTLPGHGPRSGDLPESSGAGDVTRNRTYPPSAIVDLSISFQGKFENQEIPNDIPKLLLAADNDEED